MNSPKNTLEISLPKKPFSVVKLQNLFEECQSNKSKLLENKKSDIRNDSKLSASAKLLAVAEAKLSDSENKDCENLFINYVYNITLKLKKLFFYFEVEVIFMM